MKTPFGRLLIAATLLASANVAFAQGTGTLTQLQQFVSTTSPSSAITQQTYGKAIKLTGLTTGQCLVLDTNNILTTQSCSAGGGEANTGGTLGTGLNLFDSKSGVTLRFNSLAAGSGIALSTSTQNNTIVISATGGGGNSFAFPWTALSWGNATSTTLGFLNGFLSTASSTINAPFRLPTLSNGALGVGAGGLVYSYATTTQVSAISINSTNGFAGSSSGGATPALTISTTISGVLKGNGTAISAAANGSDYSLISALSCSAGNHLATVAANGTFTCTADSGSGGTVTAVTGTWPVVSSGGTAPNLTWAGLATSSPIAAASGILYATGANTFASIATSSAINLSITGNAGTATALAANGTNCSAGNYPLGVDASGNAEGCTSAGTGTVTAITGTWPIISSGGNTPNLTFGGLGTSSPLAAGGAILYATGVNTAASVATSTLSASSPLTGSLTQIGSGGSLGIQVSTNSQNGYLSAVEHSKAFSATTTFSAPLTYTLGTNAVTCTNASSGVTGCLTGTDWNTFNSKQATISATWPITLTGAALGFNGLGTSSPIAAGAAVLYATGPNTVASVATSSPTNGTGISLSGAGAVVGGSLSITNTGVTSIVAGTNITISGGTGAVTINSTGGGGGTNYLTNSSNNTYLNIGRYLQAPALTATSSTATTTIANFQGVLWVPTDFATNGCAGDPTKTDFGACVNALYSLASTSGNYAVTIKVPIIKVLSTQWSTPINFNINAFTASLQCERGAVLIYGGTATSTIFNFGNPTGHTISDDYGCSLQGNTTRIAANQSNSKTTGGIAIGGGNGGVGIDYHDNDINGFGMNIGMGGASNGNSYMNTIRNNSISGGNSAIPGNEIYIGVANNSGERNIITQNSITDPGGTTSAIKAVYVAPGGTASNFITLNSIDDVQIFIGASNGTNVVSENHVENSDCSQYGSYAPIQGAVSDLSTQITADANEFANDCSGGNSFDTLFKVGGPISINGLHIDNYAGGTIPAVVDHSLDNGVSGDLVCGVQVQGGTLTNIIAGSGGVTYDRATGVGCVSNVDNSYSIGLRPKASNTNEFFSGNSVVGTFDHSGNWTLPGTLGVGTTTPSNTVQVAATAANSGVTGLLTTDKAFYSSSNVLIGSIKANDGTYVEPQIWMGQYALAPSFTNYVFNLDDGGSGGTVVNAPGSNNLSLRINNVDAMKILGSNGFAGFGTSTPGSLFSVGGNGTGTNFFNNSTTTKSGVGGYNISGGCFAVNGNCIGGTGGGSGTVTSIATNNGITGGTITSTGTIGLATIAQGVLGNIGSASAVPTSIATSSLFTGTTGQTGYFASSGGLMGTSTLFINTNRRVGINTTNPAQQLEVDGSAYIAGGDLFFDNDHAFEYGNGSTYITGNTTTNLMTFVVNSVTQLQLTGSKLLTTNASTTALTVAGNLTIPYGSSPSILANGDIGVDSTSNQVKYQSNGATKVLGDGNFYPSFTYSTSSAWTATTTIPLGPAFTDETWNAVKCFTDAGTLNVAFNDGTNFMNYVSASTTVGNNTLFTNNTIFTSSAKRYVNVGTPASSPTKISCTVSKSLVAN